MISLLVAMDRNHVIGYENDMPWHLPKDLKHFKEKTTENTMIMGRKTFDSIGRVLPNRKNVILTEQEEYNVEGAHIINQLDDVCELNEKKPDEELFIIGGGALFKQVLPHADRMYITEIHEEFPGDTYFPSFSKTDWKLTKKEKGTRDDKNPYDYYFLQYDRVK